MRSVEQNRPSGDKIPIIELSKNVDKASFYGGLATYYVLGIPLFLAIAAFGAGSLFLTDKAEKGAKNFAAKFRNK